MLINVMWATNVILQTVASFILPMAASSSGGPSYRSSQRYLCAVTGDGRWIVIIWSKASPAGNQRLITACRNTMRSDLAREVGHFRVMAFSHCFWKQSIQEFPIVHQQAPFSLSFGCSPLEGTRKTHAKGWFGFSIDCTKDVCLLFTESLDAN